jgi:hypothetical protein
VTRRAGVLVTFAALVTIAGLTLLPGEPSSEPRVCCYPADFTLNILLFVPLGVGLAMMGARIPLAALAGLVFSAAIETSQLWIPGRFPSMTDVLSNSLGTVLGAVLIWGWPARARWWRIVGPGLAVTIAAAWVVAVPMVRPAKARTGRTWWAEWRPPNRGLPRFSGQVLGLSLQGFALPDGAIAESPALAAAVRGSDTVRFSARIVSGPLREEPTQIAGVFMGAPWWQYLSLWQEGQDLLVYQRLQMNEWGFRSPALRVRAAFPAVAGVPLDIAVRATRREVQVTVTGEPLRQAQLVLAPEEAWTAFLPFRYTRSDRLALWPALLTLGTFLVAGAGLRGGIVPATLLALIALVPGALIAGSSLPAWPIYVAAALGLWSGRRTARLLRLV